MKITYPDGSVVRFGYDGLGRRVFRQEGSNVRYFYYDEDRIIAEREGNAWVVRYLLGLRLSGFVANGQVRVYHADRLGSVRWVTDGSQNIVVSYVYEGFGKIVGQNGGGGEPYQFCGLWGYRNDQDAGLMHVGARYYEFETGRWVQKDPLIGDVLNLIILNQYTYVEGNPLNLIDPKGLVPPLLVVGAALLLVGIGGWIAHEGGYKWGDEVGTLATGIDAVIMGVILLPTDLGFLSGKLIGGGVAMCVAAIVDLVTGEWYND